MFTTAFPESVKVMFCEELLPTAIFPNETFVGLIVKPGCDCVAVPLSGIASGEPGALLTIETLPVAAPAAVGADFTLNDVLWPALSVAAESPIMLNPTVHPADILDNLHGPCPMYAADKRAKAWHLVKQDVIKPLLGGQPRLFLDMHVAVQAFALQKR